MLKKYLTGAAVTLLVFTALPSCRKYLDVNQNPNVAREVQPALLLTSAQLTTSSALGVDLNIIGSVWGQYFTQNPNSSQYRRLEQYQPDAPLFDRSWALFYSGALADLQEMDRLAAAQNLTQYRAIGKLWMAYNFHLITDAWGDVPFSEALKGLPSNGGITAPRFDPQPQIYDGLIAMVDSGLALINPDDPNHPGSDDLIYGGDMSLWQHFGATLKLKIYLRMALRDPAKAQAGITALYASGATFIGEEEDALIQYSSTAGNQNPLYSEIVGLGRTENLVASSTVVDAMIESEDERVFYFFNPVGTAIVAIDQGDFANSDPPSTISTPSSITGAYASTASAEQTAPAPIRFISSYESLLLQAEAVARGWGTGNAEELYDEAVAINFRTLGIEEEAYDRYIDSTVWGNFPTGGTGEQQIRHIITQKWFCMTGTQGFEAWTEWRRTGYPDFFQVSRGSLIGNTFPVRFLYPSSELSRNASFPGQVRVVDRVWWDVQ